MIKNDADMMSSKINISNDFKGFEIASEYKNIFSAIRSGIEKRDIAKVKSFSFSDYRRDNFPSIPATLHLDLKLWHEFDLGHTEVKVLRCFFRDVNNIGYILDAKINKDKLYSPIAISLNMKEIAVGTWMLISAHKARKNYVWDTAEILPAF